ncbi:ABC transporter permease [Mailhella massiliensis]|uniref:ABC transporter permease n=1 Tax=Mailhella massiliensis TaxID=1903261 RepID=UPI00097D1263|nr:ABC transporter permease [Mailhella massiliensis]
MTLSKRKMAVVAPVASICIFILLWELVSLNVSAEFLPSPLAVVKEAVRLFHANISGTSLIGHIGWSLSRVLIAFFLAIILGLPLGLYMGWSRIFEKIISPIFEVLRPIPPIAWIPIAILWLGVAEGSKIFICFVGAFVIMILNAYTGMRYVDPLLIDAAKSFGASRSQQFFNVAVPACMPSIFAGVQNALSMAWMCVLAAEMVGARQGVGFIIIQGMDLNKPAMILVGMAIIGIVGSLLAAALRWVERLLCPWRRELV